MDNKNPQEEAQKMVDADDKIREADWESFVSRSGLSKLIDIMPDEIKPMFKKVFEMGWMYGTKNMSQRTLDMLKDITGEKHGNN